MRADEQSNAAPAGEAEGAAYVLLWGDLHRQTALTCGEGTYEDHVRAARERYGIDFLAVTDNARLAEDPRLRQFAGARLREHRHFFPALEAHSLPEGEWDRLRRFVAEREGEEPIFLLGYEWCSNRYGDRNVYYLEDGPLALPPDLYALHRATAAANPLIVVHHPGYARGRRGADWNHHDPRLERLVEIFSTQHGSSEGLEEDPAFPLYSRSMGGIAAPSSVQEALLRRLKLGFTGGSDAHRLDQRPGLTGAYASDRSRRALWEALRERRTIATTGLKFPLWFEADGHPMGSIVTTDALPEFRIRLPEEGWERVELIRNGRAAKVWERSSLTGECAERAGERQERGENGAGGTVLLRYVEADAGSLWPDNYYYARIVLSGNHRAWSSPIWVSYLPDAPFAHDTLYWLPEERCLFWAEREGGAVRLSVQNAYAAGEGAGGLRAPADVTLRDVRVEVVRPSGRIEHSAHLGDVPEGAGGEACLPVPEGPHYFRLSYLDFFDNRRCVERHAAVAAGEDAVFRIAERWKGNER